MQETHYTETIGMHLNTIINNKQEIHSSGGVIEEIQKSIKEVSKDGKISVASLDANYPFEKEIGDIKETIEKLSTEIETAKRGLHNLLSKYYGMELEVSFAGELRTIVIEEDIYNEKFKVKYNGDYL